MGISKDDILAVLREHPEVIIEALEKRPDLLLSLILKIAPWDRLATKEDIKLVIEAMERRFKDMNKRFEDLVRHFDKRFEEINKRFEDINKRFEDINKWFEDLTKYLDKRLASTERLVYAFNIPTLILAISLALRAFLA